MKKIITISAIILFFAFDIDAQCTSTNATSCVCKDGSTNCDLLPDIQASWLGISQNGWTEYPQTGAGTNYTGQGPDDGRLRVTGATPNNGFGSFTVRGQNSAGRRTFLCGTDTFFNVSATGAFTCPNGNPNPRQLITQRVYHKNGNQMTYTDRWAGSQTYHASHGHNHVDDWAVMTLRVQTSDPNPLNWPIIGEGAKIGFCLMDYGQCGTSATSTYYGFCRDTNMYYQQGSTMLNNAFPNWGLGGGSYNCSVIEQGISSGWLDVYGKHLDGMWINIPRNTCNGNYWIVMEVDKNDNFLEEDETNNWTAVPVTLTRQLPANTAQTPEISAIGSKNLCAGGSVQLTCTGGSSFLWSNGATTQRINVNTPGVYSVTVTSYCGTNVSNPYTVNQVSPPNPIISGDTSLCANASGMLTVTNPTGNLINNWYDNNGNWLAYSDTLMVGPLLNTTQYAVVSTQYFQDTLKAEPHTNGIGGGGYLSSAQYEIFNSFIPFTLKSVLIYSQNAGNVVIALQDSTGTDIQLDTVALTSGQNRVELNFNVPVGTRLRLAAKSMTTSGLYRNNNSAIYPYSLNNVLSIIGASGGSSYFYYFYDWEVLTSNGFCTSPSVPVTVNVTACSGLSMADLQFEHDMKIMPNPNSGQFQYQFNASYEAEAEISVHNLLGQNLFTKSLGRVSGLVNSDVNLLGLSPGVYMLHITFDGKPYNRKFVVE